MKANTNEMKRIAGEINSLAIEYQTLISNLYSKLSNMPSTTREWTGTKAQEYVNHVLLDKQDFMSVGDKLKGFSKLITNDANVLESNSAKIRKDENND